MAGAGRILIWWDRDFDLTGRPIRADVRLAAHDIWELACRRTEALVGDHAPAAELMENSVLQVSRYLDRSAAPLDTRKHGLLLVAFCRALRRHAAKMGRVDFVGGSAELSHRTIGENWTARVDARLDLENIVRQLSERHGNALMLKAAGYEWREIAQLQGCSIAAIRNGFWREIARIRNSLEDGNSA
jgi:DNA-directed RNA polymerase specialized sigma24 family protein